MDLTLVNYINVILATILVPATIMNIAIQLSSNMDRSRILQEYNKKRKDYNLLLVVYGMIGMLYLHPVVGTLIFINLVTWFAGDLYHFLAEEETDHV